MYFHEITSRREKGFIYKFAEKTYKVKQPCRFMLFTLNEFFDMILMTIVVGYIFQDMFEINKHQHSKEYDPLAHYQQVKKGIDFDNLKFSIFVTAPGILFHELGHKFVALALHTEATFHASYLWLLIGVLLKWFNTGFIFFVPGYVSHSAAISPLSSAAIAFAGPAVNLLLWLGAWVLLKIPAHFSHQTIKVLSLIKQINMFLFFFNMIPLGFFDGAKVLDGVLAAF